MKEGQTEKAVAELRVAMQQKPEDRTALNQLTLALRRLGKSAEADELASRLRLLLQHEERAEVERNRVRLVKAEK